MKAIEEFIKDIEGSADLQNDIKNIFRPIVELPKPIKRLEYL